MSRQTIVRMAAVNITVFPHPDGVYSQLIRAVRRRKIRKPVWGNRAGVFTHVWDAPSGELRGVHGTISSFVNFDSASPWFDIETNEEASEDELNRVEVPENLRPELRKCEFVLDERNHVLSFNCDPSKGGIAPTSMKKFLDKVFAEEHIAERFGPVSVNIVHPEESVDEMFELANIREVFIRANRPNVGDYDGTPFTNLNRWMEEQNVNTFEQRTVADGSDMVPDEKVKALARVADENGFVEIAGRNEFNQAVKLSTKQSAPLVEQKTFDADVTLAVSVFYGIAEKIAQSIRRRRRR